MKKHSGKRKVRHVKHAKKAEILAIQKLALSGLKVKKNHFPKLRDGYVKTGVAGLDVLLKDGIPNGSSILICGGPGSGKTILCLQLCYNAAKAGEKCLYMSFEEPEERLREHMRDFNWNPEQLEKEGRLMIRRFDPFDITRSIEALLTKAKKELLIKVDPVFFPKDFKPTMIVLDSMSAIAAAFVGRESNYRIYIEQLFRFFEELKATSYLITETEFPESMGMTKSGVEGFLADGIIIMHYVTKAGVRNHAIEILKIRGGNFEQKKVELKIIKGKGIVIYPNKIMEKSK